MQACFRAGLRSPTVTNKISTFLTYPISSHSRNPTLKMEVQLNSKRPTCPNCTKPFSLCLCTRLKTPKLDNKVHVTILQHSLEKKHPLNSARIVKLGLKNVDLFNVSDVTFEAQFDIRPVGSDYAQGLLEGECALRVCENVCESLDSDGSLEVKGSRKRGFDQVVELDSGPGSVGIEHSERFSDCLQVNIDEIFGLEGSGGSMAKEDDDLVKQFDAEISSSCGNSTSKDANQRNDQDLLSVTIEKYGKISHISHQWKLQDEGKAPKFDHLISLPEVLESLAGGFVVKKLQKKQKSGSIELEQFKEFEITVPPGSALLFPAQKAVPVEGINFEVKNLIVLDGTWAKANRMYNENPWLRILPCVRLDVEKMSLFNEVRHQPKLGYLSTIESIVYALEAIGESKNLEGLADLLDVFVSMVEDQRRCKEERLKKLSAV